MKNVGRLALSFAVLLLMGRPSFPQERLSLTLEESIRMALTHNPFHLAAEQRIDAAHAQVREARAGFFPTLNAQGLSTLDEKVFELEFPSLIPGEPAQRVEVDFTRDYQMSLSLSLPLFTGGRLRSSYKYANLNLENTREAARLSRHQTVYNTKGAFYGVLLGREVVRVAQAAVADAERLHQNIKVQHEVGLASRFDLLRSEVRVVNLKPQLIQARNNLKIMELNLKTVLGIDLEREIDVLGKLDFKPVQVNLEAALEKAMQNRPEIHQIGHQRQMARENLTIARSSALPTVALSGQFNYWADALNLKKETWQNYYTINLVLTVPIFNGFVEFARMGQAKALIKEIEFNRKGLMDRLEFEVRQAVLKVEEARESLLSQEKNVEQAQESLRIAELNFQEGMVTVLDVSQSQTALSQARLNYFQALFNYVMAMAELNKAMGVD